MMMPARHNPLEAMNENYEMLEEENSGAMDRLQDLERRVLEQGDEIVCLKTTLAETLRRVTILEGLRVPPNPPRTPVRNGNSYEHSRIKQPMQLSAKVNSHENSVDSSLPQRKAVHYQSTSSLHSDSQSSSSLSPIPSSSPRATPLPAAKRASPINRNGQNGSNGLHKRWNSTGNFNNLPLTPHSKFSNKSFLNLYSKSSPLSTNIKHGTKTITYNKEDHTLQMYLKGKPLTFHLPSDLIDNFDISKVSTAPNQKIRLDWAYGYRGRDCRSNLYMLPTGEMIYFVASVVILYNVEEQSQRHYLGHTSDVKSLAIHPNKLIVATGQCNSHDTQESRAHIRIWSTVSLTTLSVVGANDFDTSVCCISFSKADNGTLLLAVDEASDHNISVWDWTKGVGRKIAETKCSVDTIVVAEFHPLDRNSIVTCGKSHIGFWTLDVGGTLYKRMGIFEMRDKPKFVLCVSFLQTGEVITGDSNGNLAIWGRGTNTVQKVLRNIHEGPIFSTCVLKDGSVVTGGGKDGRILKFDSNLNKTEEIYQIEGHFGGVRVISEGRGPQLLVGTTRNCILTGSGSLGFQPVVLGHADELCGLTSHPAVPQFATAGHDRILQMWDSLSHNILWSKDIGEAAQSLAFSADGSVIAAGCTTGHWLVFDSQTRELLGQFVDGPEPITVIRYSPRGSYLALGSLDTYIYIYQVTDENRRYTRVGKCGGHSSAITCLDWSEDDQILRSNSANCELILWNPNTCRPLMQPENARDAKWFTTSCVVSWSTVGIWPENGDNFDVRSCNRSRDDKLLVAGDNGGRIRLYSYPVVQPKSLNRLFGGHSSCVTNIVFLHDDSRVVSTGGKDTGVLQWVVS